MKRGSFPFLFVTIGIAALLYSSPSSSQSFDPAKAQQAIKKELEQEKRDRKPPRPSVDDIVSALKKAGLKLADLKQVLAKPMFADYCLSALYEDAGLTLCEYTAKGRLEQALRYNRAMASQMGGDMAAREKLLILILPVRRGAKFGKNLGEVLKLFKGYP